MTARSARKRLPAKVAEALAGVLGVGRADLAVRANGPSGAELVVAVGRTTFVVAFQRSTSAALVAAKAAALRDQAGRVGHRAVPVVAVPFMGEVGRRACEDAGVGWFDLSGNAHLVGPDFRVIIQGQPNRFRPAGRPANVFAPKSSRLVRWLLAHPDERPTQREIARATGLDEGFVSRLVSRLEREGYLARDEGRAVHLTNPALVLDSWREAYDFSRHTLRQGHVAARSGDALLRFVADSLAEEGVEYAATGLAAAWVLTRFAAFRTVTVYLPAEPAPAILEQLGFRDDPRGANLWLVVPNDAGVFQDAVEKRGLRCVHPVQAYLDLKGQPERSAEAAERIRSEFLTWTRDG